MVDHTRSAELEDFVQHHYYDVHPCELGQCVKIRYSLRVRMVVRQLIEPIHVRPVIRLMKTQSDVLCL